MSNNIHKEAKCVNHGERIQLCLMFNTPGQAPNCPPITCSMAQHIKQNSLYVFYHYFAKILQGLRRRFWVMETEERRLVGRLNGVYSLLQSSYHATWSRRLEWAGSALDVESSRYGAKTVKVSLMRLKESIMAKGTSWKNQAWVKAAGSRSTSYHYKKRWKKGWG